MGTTATDETTETTETFRIEPTPPFDFGQSLEFLRGFVPCSGDHHCTARSLTTGGFADDRPFTAVVSNTDDGTLRVAVDWLDDPGDSAAVDSWLRGFLSLDDDLEPLYRAAADDPAFGPVVEDLHGYHHVRFSTPFECACWAALSQRTPMQVSTHLKRELVEACGRVATVDGQKAPLFPTPEMVAEDPDAVRRAIDHDRKAKTVLAAAAAFVSEDLTELDDHALRDQLADVWGFGNWSSEFVALRGFGRLSGLPRSERRLREAVADLYGLDTDAASDEDLDGLSEPYAPMQGYWAHYIRVWAFRSR